MTPPCFAINKWTERPSQAIWNSAAGVRVGSLWSQQLDTHKPTASLVPAAGSKSLIYWSHLSSLQTAAASENGPSHQFCTFCMRRRWQARGILKKVTFAWAFYLICAQLANVSVLKAVCACSHESLKSWIYTGSEEDKMVTLVHVLRKL